MWVLTRGFLLYVTWRANNEHLNQKVGCKGVWLFLHVVIWNSGLNVIIRS